MYKDVAKKILAAVLAICMIAGITDLTAFTVEAADGTYDSDNWHFVYQNSMEYTGSQLKPTVEVSPIQAGGAYGTALGASDYTLSYGENIQAGTGTIHVAGNGAYADTLSQDLSFRIGKKSIGNNGTISSGISVAAIPNQYYNEGNPIIPASITVTDTVRGVELNGVYDGNAVPGQTYDYTYTCSNNTEAGTATLRVEGQGNYKGYFNTSFTIEQRDSSLLQIAAIGSLNYTGNKVEPKPTVTYDGTVLIEGTHFTFRYSNNTYAGEATVYAVGQGEYAGLRAEATYWIKKDLQHATISVDPIGNKVYDGVPVTLNGAADIVVRDSDKAEPLVFEKDWKIASYLDNDAVGEAVVRIEGIGAYKNSVDACFRITNVTMDVVDITVASCIYNGERQTPAVTVSRGGVNYSSSDYTLTYSGTDAGNGTVTVTGNGSRLQGTATKNFTISRKPLSDADIEMTLNYPSPQQYTGTPIRPAVTVKYNRGDSLPPMNLEAGKDYRISYENDTNAGQATATITAINGGNYVGSKSVAYTINPAPVTDFVIQDIASREYTGAEQRPVIKVFLNGAALRPFNESTGAGSYTVTYENNINVGDGAKVIVHGCGNYAGTKEKTFEITPKDISTTGVTVPNIPAQTYDGTRQTPAVTVTYKGMTLGSGDIRCEYGDNTTNCNAGNAAYVDIYGEGNYTGHVRKTFTISKRSLSTGNYLSISNLEEAYSYTGTAIELENPEVIYNNPGASMNTMLTKDTDYETVYTSNTAMGTATLRINGIGNYSGYKTFNFKIKGDLADDSRTDISIPDQVYTGSAISDPAGLTVKFNGTVLRKGTDYDVVCANNIEPGGAAEAVITGKNNYMGSVTAYFTIGHMNLDELPENSRDYIVSGINTDGYEYSGFEIKPEVSITYRGTPLTEGEAADYTLNYENNVDVGTEAKVIVAGVEPRFTGSTSRKFKINPYNIGQASSAVTVSGVVENVVWDDVDSTSGIQMTENGIIQTNFGVSFHCTNPETGAEEDRTLTEGTDYNVSYEHNEEIGTATLVITGKDGSNFTGTIRKDFAIRGDLNNTVNAQIQEIADWEFLPGNADGPQNRPSPIVTHLGKTLVEGTDYTVSYTDNDKIGTATVTVTAVPGGNYVNSISREFQIVKRHLTLEDENLVITGLVEEGYEYTGSLIIPELTITYCGVELTADDITIVSENNVNVPGEDDPQPVVKVTAVDSAGCNYTGSFEIPFTINPRKVSEDTIRVEGLEAGYDYDNGNEIVIPDEVLKIYYGEESTPLVKDTDYTVSYAQNTQIGTAVLTITGIGNYAQSLEKNFYVMGNLDDFAADYITVAPLNPVPFGIVAVYPDIVITDNSSGEVKTLELGTDFEITDCINNVNVAAADSENPPTVTVAGIGCYKGSFSRTFDIIPKNLTEDEGDITAAFTDSINTGDIQNAFIYTGEGITPEITVYNHGVEMTPGVDYQVVDYVNNVEVPEESVSDNMRPGVVIEAIEGGNYVGRKTMYFDIIPQNIDFMQVSFTDEEPLVYDRTEKRPGVRVTYTAGEETITLPEENYEVEYLNNTEAATPSYANPPTVVITGTGNYGGTLTKTFTIQPENLQAENTDIICETETMSYTGNALMPEVSVKAADGTVLLNPDDYTVGSATSNVNAGIGYVTVTGRGNYTGSRQVPFTIEPKKLSDGDIVIEEIGPQDYTGAAVQPLPEVKWEHDGTAVNLVKDRDYEVTYRANINTGTGYVIITGKEGSNYTLSQQKEFSIVKKTIGIDGVIDTEMTLEPIEDQQYTGSAVIPAVTLAYNGGINGSAQTLVQGRDFIVNCAENTAVGTAAVTISGINNYTGSIQSSFRIVGNLSGAVVAKIPPQRYTGQPVEPQPAVTFAGKTLRKDTDYKLEYSADHTSQGTASVKVVGTGDWYIGSQTVTFDIAKNFSADMRVDGLAKAYTYTGKEVKPAVRVTDGGTVLTQGRDYSISYKNCVNVGTATLTISGTGAYSGSKQVTYKITSRNIAQGSVSSIKSQNYTGKAVKPALKVTVDGKTLTAGKDYKVVYVSNIKPGKASVIVKGISNYIGSKTVSYNIVIPKVSSLKQSKATTKSVTLSWKRNSAVSGYEIYTSSNKKVKTLKNSQTSYTVTGLKAGKSYSYKIRAYVIKNGERKRGAFVSLRTSTSPSATKITYRKSSKSKQVVVKWKKVSGATDYVVYRSTSSKGKYKQIAVTKRTSYTDKKAAGGKRYYYKVRARRVVDKKNYYSSYSGAASVTAKK